MTVRLFTAAFVLLAAAPLAAQQDTGMMAHDTGMMAHDTGMMAHDTGMMKDEKMGAGANMMFMGAEGAKASGDYTITDVGGRNSHTGPRSAALLRPHRQGRADPGQAQAAGRGAELRPAQGEGPGQVHHAAGLVEEAEAGGGDGGVARA